MTLVTVAKSFQSLSTAEEYTGSLGTILKASVSLQPILDPKMLDFTIKMALEMNLRDSLPHGNASAVTYRSSCHTMGVTGTSSFVMSYGFVVLSGM